MYDTIIFDLDGTLLNTIEDLTDAVNYTLVNYGFSKRTTEEVKSFVGNGMENLLKKSLPITVKEDKFKEIFNFYKNYYSKNSQKKTHLYEGVLEMLRELKDRNIKISLVSNKNHNSVLDLYDLYFREYMKVVIGDRPGFRRKPSPDSIYEAIKVMGAEKENTLYIGDSEVDILTAQNAGIPCVLVTWGFRTKESLINSGGKNFINKPEELLDLINKKLM